MKKTIFLFYFVLIFVLMVSFSCTPQENNVTPDLDVIDMPLATITPTGRPTQNHPTSTPVPSPTWTPLPTLSSIEAEQTITDLLKSNGGCKLPCWWGSTSGETRWDETEQFLNAFVINIGKGQEGSHQEDDGYHSHTNYTVHYNIPEQETEGLTVYSIRDGIIIGVDVNPPGNELSYQLHQLLSVYGQPQEVYILTYPNVPFDILPFRILIRYPDQGIYAIYEYPAKNDGNTISSCPDSTGPSLHLDAPNQSYEKYLLPFEDSAKRLMGINENDPLVDLQTATQMDVKTFYETFKNKETGVCLKTPASMW